MLGIARDVTERKKVEKQIKESLKEKEILLKEIHHRVKNNLQVISSLLNLQSEGTKDKETTEMFRDCQNRIRSMAFIHESLYQSKDLARVNYAEYIQKLTNYLFHSYDINRNVIQLSLSIQNVLMDVDKAIPCGLIINELISNSLKHAFPSGRAGEISIDFKQTNDVFTLMVSDNGIGLTGDINFRETESLGLQLVNTLVEQLDGSISLEGKSGTAFRIQFGGFTDRKGA